MVLKHRLTTGFLAVFLFGAVTVSLAGPASGDRPVLAAEETRHEFGTVIEGATVSHEFVIANKGTVPLHIIKIESG